MKGATPRAGEFRSPLLNFNPRTREGCDKTLKGFWSVVQYFNPRTREGCDIDYGYNPTDEFKISIHAPVKGATWLVDRLDMLSRISIHAPVKGATSGERLQTRASGISIHAPVKGATTPCRGSAGRSHHFNPRTREGCDALRYPDTVVPVVISIHAPVKGATLHWI